MLNAALGSPLPSFWLYLFLTCHCNNFRIMKHSLLLCFLFSISYSLVAQDYADCSTALEICNKQPLILPLLGPGNDATELDNAPCFAGLPSIETSSAWIRWQVAQSGTLWFIIYPLNPVDDVDFLLYHLPSGNCAEKSSVRCMAAGDFSINSSCMGPTGLLPGEVDTNGPPGCAVGQNNFLAPVNVLAGEQYVLAINNFSSVQDTLRIEFCGTALLGCDTIMCQVLDANEPNSSNGLSVGLIFPNPASAENGASVQINASYAQVVNIRIADSQNLTLKQDYQVLSEGANTIPLHTFKFPAGIYFVTVISEKTMVTKRLVITN